MSIGARLSTRVTRLAVGQHLPPRAVRLRLTLLYGALFLLSGAALMAIAYALLINAGFVFTIQNSTQTIAGRPAGLAGGPPRFPLRVAARAGLPVAGLTTHPTKQALAQWSTIAECMHEQGISAFPNPRTSVPSSLTNIQVVSDRDGAILAFPATLNMESQAFTRAGAKCGFFVAGQHQPKAVATSAQSRVERELVLQSGIALAGMSLLSLGLGWLFAGRVLQPLEDSYEAQRQFVANASHELRTPLARQRALIQVALADPEASLSSLRAANERVLASEEELEQMIDALLTLTRSQAGPERREQFDLAAIASRVILAREPELAGRDLDAHTTLATAPATGDPRLVERLIANLIDNAIRHNTRGGDVEITTGTRDRHAVISIVNTGPPVPPEEVERLFQPFQRLDGARTQHNNGHGLGLSIVKAIANAHGADLVARPRPEGGLTIDAVFPPVTGAGQRITLPAWTRRRNPRPSLSE